ncbi:hypothetical protein ACMXYX_15835 [Neptuniibacter sp. QD72_48]|uniref:hypothetical protein n=1 Tax=Neptuniibacter sp. QD72_48 TaxID=3398214 RepID=UPI0039F5B378
MTSTHCSPESWLQLEGIHILNPHFINHIKRQAKKLSKDKSHHLALNQALDIICISYGFDSWNHLQKTFAKERAPADWTSSTSNQNSPNKKFDFCTDKQLHGAVCRYLKISAPTQVIQFVVDDSDYYKPAAELHDSDIDTFTLLLTKGIIPDYSLQHWLTENDPYFDPDLNSVKAFRLICPKHLNHIEACQQLEKIFIDINFIGSSYSCWPHFIWIDGLLSDETLPPDLGLGDDSLPISLLPKDIFRRVY